MRLFLFAIFILSHGIVKADTCDDLFSQTCNSQAQSKITNLQNSQEQMLTDIADRFQKQFHEALKNDIALRIVTLRALGNQAPPSCKKTLDDKTCQHDLSTSMAAQVKKNINREDSVLNDLDASLGLKDNATFNKIIKDSTNESFDEIFKAHAGTYEKAQNIILSTKRTMIAKIQNEVADEEIQKMMIKRIQDLSFDPKGCNSSEALSPGFVANSSAFMNPPSYSFTICPRMLLSNPTDAQMSFIISHELAHSIDPCMMTLELGSEANPQKALSWKPDSTKKFQENYESLLKQHPYSSVLSCLRQERSAHATSRSPEDPGFEKPLEDDPYTNKLCFNEQIGEAFCDWMAADSASAHLRAQKPPLSSAQMRDQYSSVFITKCEEKPHTGFEAHPEVKDRANGILAVNPQVRKDMGCTQNSLQKSHCALPQKTPMAAPIEEENSSQEDGIQ